jgi:hypothetical protein
MLQSLLMIRFRTQNKASGNISLFKNCPSRCPLNVAAEGAHRLRTTPVRDIIQPRGATLSVGGAFPVHKAPFSDPS